MKMKASAKASGSIANIRSCRQFMFCFLVGSTLLMLASTSLLHHKPGNWASPDSVRRPSDPSSGSDSAYSIRKPLPAKSLNALAEDETVYSASNHREALSSAEAGDQAARMEVQSLRGERDAAEEPAANVVQDVVTFSEDVLLIVRVSEARSRIDKEFKDAENGTFFCIFDFPELAMVFHTSVSSINRKQGTDLHFVRCSHPSDDHLVSRKLLQSSVEVFGGPSELEQDAVPDSQDRNIVGRVTLGIQEGELRHEFSSGLTYSPLVCANATWEEPLVYEITMQEESVVLLAKNLKARGSNKHFDVQDLSCVFLRRSHQLSPDGGVGDEEVVYKTRAIMGAQEVVHCEWPSLEVRTSLVGCKVSLSGSRYGGVVPSVAYFHPDSDFLKVAPLSKNDLLEVPENVQQEDSTTGGQADPPSTEAAPRQYDFHLCACTMVWNKAKFLKEWVMYHAHLGAERFFIYDNNSDDDLDDVIASLSDRNCGSKSLTDEEAQMQDQLLGYYTLNSQFWPWLKTQQAAFSHCAVRARKEGCEWVMFADVDEFIYPISYMNETPSAPASEEVKATQQITKVVALEKAVRKIKARVHKRKGKKSKLVELRKLLFTDDEGAGSRSHAMSSPKGGELEQFEEYRASGEMYIYESSSLPEEGGLSDGRRNVVAVAESDLGEVEQDGDCDTDEVKDRRLLAPKDGLVSATGHGNQAFSVKSKPPLRRLIEDVAVNEKPVFFRVNATGPLSRIGEIRFDCHNFGPSGLKHHPKRGVLTSYTCRTSAPQRHKSIVRTDAVSVSLLNLLHHFELRPGFESVSIVRKFGIVNHYKFQVWEDFKLKFVRRAGTYTTDWTLKKNEQSRDRTPGLATEPVMPDDWHERFCEVRATLLKDYVKRTFTTNSGKLLWQ